MQKMLTPPLIGFSGVALAPTPTPTWAYTQGGCSLIERGVRIRPDRSNPRRQIQKLTWKDTHWVEGFTKVTFDNRMSSLTIADVSPRLAIRRILMLFENYQYREAANFITRLNHATFKAILIELPIDVFVDAMPQSLPMFESLYAKVFLSDGLNAYIKLLKPEAVVMQMVKYFAKQDDSCAPGRHPLPNGSGPVYPSCRKVLKVIVMSEPKVRLLLHSRRRALDKAIEGLGQHGLVGTSDESLMNLHDALRLEFEKVLHSYKIALHKLDEMCLIAKTGTITSRSVYYGPAPINASHQRQLSLKQNEIQERLIKNKTLLNMIEPTLENHSLDVFLEILQRRIEHDKDVLFQFTQLKREAKDVNPDSIVAPILMRFSHGCEVVLSLMKEVATDDDDDSSDISGYHSDSDSAIMMSGNSPYVSKSARYNFLYRSIRSNSRTSGRRSPSSTSDNLSQENKLESARSRSKYKKPDHVLPGPNGALPKGGSCPNCSDQMPSTPMYELEMKKEVEGLRCDLMKARQTIVSLQDREHQLKERLAEQAQRMIERGGGGGTGGGHFENVALGDKRPTALIRRYGNLYAQARVDTLDALDSLPELHDAEELKSKLLFSVIVLAFRSVHSTIRDMKDSLRLLLQMPDSAADPFASDLEASVFLYLKKTVDRYDVKKNIEEVCSQIWATLYDYPCLKTCDGLVQYIRDCVKLAWGLCNQTPPFVIEYETRLFRRDWHVRFHTSNQESEHIKTYLWPALLESDKGPCVHKGVVVT